MKAPTFLEGVLVALAASVAGSVLHTASAALLGASDPWLVVAALGFGYALYLLRRSPERVGRVSALAVWLVAAGALWLIAPSLTLYVTLHVGMLWLLRSLFFHTSPLAALADLGLNGAALAAAVWALAHTGNVLLGLWSFFLMQALFVAIPRGARERPTGGAEPADDRFELAHRVAEGAVRRLASPR
jgi:hypothetical protein